MGGESPRKGVKNEVFAKECISRSEKIMLGEEDDIVSLFEKDDIYPEKVTMNRVKNAVAEYMGVSMKDLVVHGMYRS